MPKTNTTTTDLDHLAGRLEHLSRFHERLWDDAPDVAAARARAGRMTAAVAALADALTGTRPVERIIDDALDALLDGHSPDAGQLRSDVTAALAAAQVASAAQAAINARGVTVAQDATNAERAHADVALRALHATLTDLVDVGLVLLPLCDLTGTVADTARAGQARALFTTAVDVHDQLRAEQTRLSWTPERDTGTGDLVRQFGIVRDVSSLEPWSTVLRFGNEGATNATPLPDIALQGGEPLFRLVLRADLDPWVPTRSQLRAAAEAMRQRVDAARHRKRNPNTDRTPINETNPVKVSVNGQPVTSEQTVTYGARRVR